MLSSAAGFTGGVVAAAGLAGRELTGDPVTDAAASAFALVVGPTSLIVDADVIFEDGLNVPEVETAIVSAAAALRTQWPAVASVYLNPVA